MKNRILVVDDEKEIADLVEIYLVSEKFDVIKCYDGDTAIDAIEHEKIDLAILDIMLPGISGLELCRRIRKKENYPVIMLTAKDSEVDKVTGLTIGADDYVTKPFLPLELVARVKAQLRRYERYGARTDQPAENMSCEETISSISCVTTRISPKNLRIVLNKYLMYWLIDALVRAFQHSSITISLRTPCSRRILEIKHSMIISVVTGNSIGWSLILSSSNTIKRLFSRSMFCSELSR